MDSRLLELCKILAKDMKGWRIFEEQLKDETIVKLFFTWGQCKEFIELMKEYNEPTTI